MQFGASHLWTTLKQRIHLTWKPTSEPQHPADATVPQIHGLAVHQRTPTHDAPDPAQFAFPYRVGGHAARTKRPVKPDLAHTLFTAMPDNIQSVPRMSGNYDAVDRSWYRRQVRIATHTFSLCSIRVDRQHLKSAVAQLSINGVRGLLR